MKKLVFSISLILSYTFIAIAGVVKSIPAKADEFTSGDIVTVTPSISETDLTNYNNALQILEYLRQGGTIDFSNVSDGYQTGDLLDEFIDLIDTVGSGIDYYGNNFIDNIFDLSTDTVQLSPNYKLKDRIGQFRSNLPSYLNNNNNEPDTPVPNPPLDYVTLIGLANSSQNGYGFFWGEYPLIRSISSTYNFEFTSEYIQHSWYRYSNNFVEFPNRSYNTDYTFPSSGILTLNIVSIDNQYIGTISGIDSYQCGYLVRKSDGYIASDYICGCNFTSNTTTCNVATGFNGTLQSSFSYTDSSVYNVLSYFVHRFRNINIYVNGDCWAYVGNNDNNYNIKLGTGTYLIETNQPIEYKFNIPVYVDISDLIDKIQLAIDNKITLDFPYLNDLIVDTNGQQTIAVTVFSKDYTIDDLYVQDYGAMIPLFPLWIEYPVSLEHINTVATVGIVDVIPTDIIEVLGIFLIVGLFVFLCHRLME